MALAYPGGFDNVGDVNPGDLITADIENSQTDPINAIEQTLGLTPAGPYDTVADAIAGKLDSNFVADSGAADAYEVTLDPVPTSYVAGMSIRFQAANANTGASTIDVNSLGTKAIKKQQNSALAANDIKANQIVEIVYDGSVFQMLSMPSTGTGGSGMSNPMTTKGDIMYGDTGGTATRLAGQTTSTKNFLTQTGTGSASDAPAWDTIDASDLPTLDQVPAPTANVSLNSHKITSLADPTALTDAANARIVQKGAMNYAADSGSANTYLVTLSPAPSAYVAGMTVTFKAAHANTGSSTLNVNSLGAVTLKKQQSVDLDTGDILVGQMVTVSHDGTNFQLASSSSAGLINPMTSQGDLIGGGSSGAPKRLAPNSTSTRKFLEQNNSNDAAWSTLQVGDIPTLTASKISDFDTQVNTHKVTDLTAPTSDFSMNAHKITNLANPVNDQDAVTLALVTAFPFKGTVSVVATSTLPANTYNNGSSGVGATLTANSNGAFPTIDGQSSISGDPILVAGEATAANNGIYLLTQVGDGSHPWILTRRNDFDQNFEVRGGTVLVLRGTTYASTLWLCTNNGSLTMGSTAINFKLLTTVNPMTALGDLVYGASSGFPTRLAGDTSDTRKFLREQSSSGAAAAPAWDTLQAGDIPTITSSKVSDFDSQVNTHKVTDLAAPTSDFSMNSHKITNVTDPASAQDAATKNYVDSNTAGANPMTTLGDTTYGGSSGAVTRLAGDTSDTRKFLREQSSSGTAQAPAWDTLQAGDIPTITSSKISDFDTQVRTSRLDQMAAPTADVSMNSHKITNVTDPASAQDAATKNYVDSNTAGANPMTTMGDMTYGGSSGAVTRLAGDTSDTRKFLREQSSSGTAAAPAWDTLQAADVPKTLDHTWVTDFDTEVRTSRLDQMATPTADLSINSHKLTNVTDPGSAQDAATKNYVDGKFPSTTAGTYPKVTVNASGLVTAGSSLAASDLPGTLNATAFSGQVTTNNMLDIAAGMETVTASKSSAYTLVTSDNTIFADSSGGAFSVTTPGTVNVGQRFRIYKIDSGSNAVTVAANSGQTVSGISSINSQWQGLELVAESSTQWIANLLPVYNASAYTAGTGLSLSGNQFSLTSPVALANGGTNASLTAALGAIPYSTASAIALLAPTATARQMLQSGANNAPAWSTAAWPDTTTAKQLLYSSANNTVAGLATANNGTLVTDGSGTPSISSTLPSAVQSNITIAESQVTNLTTDLAAKVTNPMTGVGDLIRGGTSGAPTRVSGAANSILVTDGSSIPSLGTALPNGVTATTQSAADNSTKVATTAYVDAAASTKDEYQNKYITSQDETIPANTNIIFEGVLEMGSGYAFELASGATCDVTSPWAPPFRNAGDMLWGDANKNVRRIDAAASSVLVTGADKTPVLSTDLPSGTTIGGGNVIATNPMTGVGDMIRGGTSGTPTRVAGAANSVLVTDGSSVPYLSNDLPSGTTIGGVAVYPSGVIFPYAGISLPTGWLLCDGSSVSRSTYSVLWSALNDGGRTCTMTIASPCVVTLNSHGFNTGDAIFLTTTGALPTGLSTNTSYYVIKINSNTFNLATTYDNALGGTEINTSGSQSGTHTCTYAPYTIPAGSSTNFKLPDLRGRVPLGAWGTAGTASGANAWGLGNTPVGATNSLAGGEEAHALTSGELANHSHTPGSLSASHSHTSGTLSASHSHNAAGGQFVTSDASFFWFFTASGSQSFTTYTGLHTATDSTSPSFSGSTASTSPTFSGSTATTGNNDAHNIMQPSTGVKFIIKT